MLTQAHKTKQQQDQPQNHHGPLQRVQEATKLNAETRDPPSQDPRDHKEQPSRHDIHPDTLKQTPTKPGRTQSPLSSAFPIIILHQNCGCGRFFFPPVWPIRTRLGPYNCISSEKQKCTRTRVVQKLWQIITKNKENQNNTTTANQKRPANPPARFAFRHKAKQRSNKKRGRAQQKQKTHSDLP